MADLLDLLLPTPVLLVALVTVLAVLSLRSTAALRIHRLSGPLLVAVVWVWTFSTPGLANLAVSYLEGPVSELRPEQSTRGHDRFIVVLGSGQMRARNGQPHPKLDAAGWERLNAGVKLSKMVGGTLVVTGGPAETPNQSLAALMRGIAMDAGIPADSIIAVPNSDNTYQDLLHARDAIGASQATIWIVTSAIHMPRALAVASQLDLQAIPWPCDYRQVEDPTWRIWFPDNGAPDVWSAVIHEVVGREYYRLRGWAR
ncbi:MAG: YdcF family protein [Rhodocyclales bacterium]|jgi:uncharacterized SAM-binding protein YcdF (DUF218 family)|nr:YdcF family protein [Rhodocyclales bacterium]